ncbi:M48 family metalloprotease [Nocardia takedensis]|uniref:M48 family metalloprotease n=1 Tax=Nocardia takedensis TaxID=259390 RepID=UPI0002F4DEA9
MQSDDQRHPSLMTADSGGGPTGSTPVINPAGWDPAAGPPGWLPGYQSPDTIYGPKPPGPIQQVRGLSPFGMPARHTLEVPLLTVIVVITGLFFVLGLIMTLAGWIPLQISAPLLLAPLLLWLQRGMLFAQLRTSGIRITPTQFPDAHRMVTEAAHRFGMAKTPDAYVVLGNGAINAFASGHGFRRFVAVNSDLFEIGGAARDPDALAFIIGHEVGHIAAGHASYWRWLGMYVVPYLPILGGSLRRAQEYTADNHGYCYNHRGARGAMNTLAGGKYLNALVGFDEMADRAPAERGFFVWLYNGLVSHPVLTWRMWALRDRTKHGNLLWRPTAPLAALPTGGFPGYGGPPPSGAGKYGSPGGLGSSGPQPGGDGPHTGPLPRVHGPQGSFSSPAHGPHTGPLPQFGGGNPAPPPYPGGTGHSGPHPQPGQPGLPGQYCAPTVGPHTGPLPRFGGPQGGYSPPPGSHGPHTGPGQPFSGGPAQHSGAHPPGGLGHGSGPHPHPNGPARESGPHPLSDTHRTDPAIVPAAGSRPPEVPRDATPPHDAPATPESSAPPAERPATEKEPEADSIPTSVPNPVSTEKSAGTVGPDSSTSDRPSATDAPAPKNADEKADPPDTARP